MDRRNAQLRNVLRGRLDRIDQGRAFAVRAPCDGFLPIESRLGNVVAQAKRAGLRLRCEEIGFLAGKAGVGLGEQFAAFAEQNPADNDPLAVPA
jgi:hypothetical protein